MKRLYMFKKSFARFNTYAQELNIGTWCLEVLSIMEVKCIACPLLSTKCVTVLAPFFAQDLPGITILLRSLPILEKLTVKLYREEIGQFHFPAAAGFGNFNDMVDKYWISHKTSSKPLLHLKTIEIIGLDSNYKGYDLVLKYIEFLLTNAVVLSQLIIDKHGCTSEFVSNVSEKLLSMPKSSLNAAIKFQQFCLSF